MKMKIKINKKKFARNILICLIALFIVALILNTAPGYKRDKYTQIINLIMYDENVTEYLKNRIYIDENYVAYISVEDAKEFLGGNIYYDEEYRTLIITTETKVASLVFGEDKMNVNNAMLDIKGALLEKDDMLYIPISELGLVYNIEVKFAQDTNRLIIDKLNKGMITANLEQDSVLKFRPRKLSKNIENVAKGQKVECFYTTSKGWRLIRTADRNIRICKSKCIIRCQYFKTRYGNKYRNKRNINFIEEQFNF